MAKLVITHYKNAKSIVYATSISNFEHVANIEKISFSSYLARKEVRATDFTSDGFIRSSTSLLLASRDPLVVERLRSHLLSNKLPVDSEVFRVDVVNDKADLIVSSDKRALAVDERIRSEWSVVMETKKGQVHEMMLYDNLDEIAFIAPIFYQSEAPSAYLVLYAQTKAQDPNLDPTSIFGADVQVTVMDMHNRHADFFHPQITQNLDLGLNNEELRALCQGKKGEGVIDTKDALGYCYVLPNNWIVLATALRQQIFAPLDLLYRDFSYVGIALLAAIAIFYFILLVYVTRPIRRFMNGIDELEHGNFTHRIAVHSRDEIGQAAREFDVMAEKLSERYAILEKMVEVRTRDLKKFKLAVKFSSDHIIITDPEGRIVYGNPAAERLTGYSYEEFVGKTPALWGGQMPKSFYVQFWDQIKNKKLPFFGELTNRRKNGERYLAEIKVAPILDEKKNIQFFVATERDVTAQRALVVTKNDFINLAAHQLRTPLSAVLWHLEMLLDEFEGKKETSFSRTLTVAYKAAQVMTVRINQIITTLNLRIGESVGFKDMANIDISKLSAVVASEVIADLKIKAMISYAPKKFNVKQDKGLLEMMFRILLTNAIQYGKAKKTSIAMSFSRGRNEFSITIKDNGIGIPAEDLSRVGTEFFRAKNAMKVHPDGSGLSLYMLSLALKIVGGRIAITSSHDGTTAVVTIPESFNGRM